LGPNILPQWTTSGGVVLNEVGGEQQVTFQNNTGQLALTVTDPSADGSEKTVFFNLLFTAYAQGTLRVAIQTDSQVLSHIFDLPPTPDTISIQLPLRSSNGSFTVYLGGTSPGDAGPQDPCTLTMLNFTMFLSSPLELEGHLQVGELSTERATVRSYLDCQGNLDVSGTLNVTGPLTTSGGIAQPFPGVHFTPTLSSFEMAVSAPNLYNRTDIDGLISTWGATGSQGPTGPQITLSTKLQAFDKVIGSIKTAYLIDPGTLPTWTPTSGASVSNVTLPSGVEQQVTFENDTGRLTLTVLDPNGSSDGSYTGMFTFTAYGSSAGSLRVAIETDYESRSENFHYSTSPSFFRMQLNMISVNGSFTIHLGGDSPGEAGTQDPCTLNVLDICMYTSPSIYYLDGQMKVGSLQTLGLLTDRAQASHMDCGTLAVHENLDVTGTLTTSDGIADPYPGVHFTPTLSSFEMDVSAPNLYDRTQIEALISEVVAQSNTAIENLQSEMTTLKTELESAISNINLLMSTG